MKSFFNQISIVLTCGLLCSSQECSNKQVYKEDEKSSSCKHIMVKYPDTPSGYYWLQSSNHSTNHKVYCDMDNEHCGSKGWTKIALVDMSGGAKTCPGNLRPISSPKRTCKGLTTRGCASAKFSTYDISYNQMCGRLRGYQFGCTNAFGPYVNDPGNADLVIDGVLISHGKTQKHIWAYAVGAEKIPFWSINRGSYNIFCPCTDHRFY